jgi:hypothetical protein
MRLLPSRCIAVCIVTLVGSATLSVYGLLGQKKPEQSRMPQANNPRSQQVECIGRFRFAVPDSMSVAGRSQSIYAVDVKTVLIPLEGIQRLWDEHLVRIRPMAPPNESAKSELHTFDLQPGSLAIWYLRDSASPRIRTLDAARAAGEYAVVVSRSGEAGKESIVEELARIVLNSYVPSTANGFCVGHGAITSEPSPEEESLITLNHGKVKDLQIRFSTRAVSTPDTTTYSDVQEEKELVESDGGRLSVLRDQQRRVAALEGKEIAISATSPKEPAMVRFTWHFPGVAQDSTRPMINIVGSAPLPQQPELQKIWDSLLQTIETVPPSPQH